MCCIDQGPVPQKMVNFNPGLSQILSKYEDARRRLRGMLV